MLRRLALAGPFLLASAPSGATLLVHEPFDYTTGVLAGQSATGLNVTGAYAGSAVPPGFELRVESPGLGYGDLVGAPAAAGNRVSQSLGTTAASATATLASAIPVDAGSAIFFSALFVFDDSENGNHLANISLLDQSNGDELTFGESVVGMQAVRISATTAATGGSAVAAGATGAFTNGQLLFLFGRYQNEAAAQSDRLDLVGYDTALATPLPAFFDPTDPNAQFRFTLADLSIDLAQITAVTFTIRGQANNFVDELRIGTTYFDVVPEPSTAPLLLAGLLALGACRRRR